jgi:signal transduction histidine kinase
MPALVGLLLVVFVIAGMLVYEAWSTGRSRRDIAERGLQDYVAYASWTTARAGDNTLSASLSTIFRGLVGNRLSPADSIPPLGTLLAGAKYLEACDCAMVLPVDYYFRYDSRTQTITTAPYAPATVKRTVEPGWAAAKVGSYTEASEPVLIKPDTAWLRAELEKIIAKPLFGFAAQIAAENDSARAIGLAPQRDETGNVIGALGFVTSAERFAGVTFNQLWQNPKILPVAITRGLPNDSLLAATVTAPGGEVIYRSPGWVDGMLSDTASLGSYIGGMTVRVALRPDATARLQGGLIPVSRVPVWVGLLLLTGLLTVVIVRNLQREHELARLRMEFSASVSHELRTPLAQILLFGETLSLNRTRSDNERLDAAKVIVREARRLMHLVDNTLTFSRAERPVVSLSPRRVHLAPLIRDTVAGFVPLASVKHAKLSQALDDEVEAVVDSEAFRQMLLNLLDNALKYGPHGQRISVGLTAGHSRLALEPVTSGQRQVIRRATIRLTVDDEGPGVHGKAKDEIWVPFARGGNGENPVGTGFGLGLAVVRELAERHNGSAWVESAPGVRGARFFIELPDPSASERPALPQASITETAGAGG